MLGAELRSPGLEGKEAGKVALEIPCSYGCAPRTPMLAFWPWWCTPLSRYLGGRGKQISESEASLRSQKKNQSNRGKRREVHQAAHQPQAKEPAWLGSILTLEHTGSVCWDRVLPCRPGWL